MSHECRILKLGARTQPLSCMEEKKLRSAPRAFEEGLARDFGIFMPGLSYSFGGTDLASAVDLTFYI